MKQMTLYDQIERLSAIFRSEGRRELGGEDNLLPIQLEMLHYLDSCNQFSNTPAALTEYLGQTKGTVSQTLNLLTGKGLLEKVADADDKRLTHLCLTEKGKALVAEKLPTQLFKQLTKTLTADETTQIEQALQLLVSKLLSASRLKSFGVCATCRYHAQGKEHKRYCQLLNLPLTDTDSQLICREHSL